MSSHPSPISTLKLRVTQGSNIFEDPVSSSTLGPNNLQITSQSFPVIFNAFNNHPPGTIFSPSVVASYATGNLATDYVLSIPSVPANFVPKQITPSISLVNFTNKLNTDPPFSLTVTTPSNGALTYSSSVPSVATVNSSGLVTPVSAGTTTITVNQAASADGVYTAASVSRQLDIMVSPLVARYTFDSNANDFSGYNNNLTNYNNVTFNTVDFKRGSGSAVFNGSNYFEIANDGRFSPDNLTVSLWIKPKETSGTHQAIASCRGGPYLYGWMLYIAPNDSLDFVTSGASGFNGTQIYNNFGGLFKNIWVHIAITLTKSSGLCRFYLNGTLYSSNTRDYRNNTVSNMRIGAGANETSPQFIFRNGTLLDDFRFYNSVLSASEISSIYAEYLFF